ncbi:MAG: class I SAM-dependent methyltransferase [Acidobacteria bacterium]|nr:class I SAM-dependent methyltransferase [Acidobacteriota bacterium]
METTTDTGILETADIETSSDGYAGRFAGPSGEWFLRTQLNITLDMLPPVSERPAILEVGGGHGQLTPHLIERGYRVVVAGSHQKCCDRIKPYLSPGRCDFVIGSPPRLPFRNGEFDTVISYRFVCHAHSWQRFLAELARVAARDVLIDYPPIISFNLCTPLLFGLKKRMEGNTRTYKLFFEKEITRVFRENGFVRAARRAEFFLPMVLHRIIRNRIISAKTERVFRALGFTEHFGSPVIVKFTAKERIS